MFVPYARSKFSLEEAVEKLLSQNHRKGGVDGKRFDYTCPSLPNYPHQWLWDSSFHAIVLTHLDVDRSKNEIRTLLLNQREDGFIPCVSIWQRRSPLEDLFYIKEITQPPVIPMAVEIIYERSKDLSFVKETYPKLKKFMDWLPEHRDRNGNGLIEIIHPWEDGDDSNPSFDKQLGIKNPKPSALDSFYRLFRDLARYSLMGWNEDRIYKSKIFISETVLFNSIYARSLLSMVRFASLIGNEEEAKFFVARYERTKEALIKLCWSEKDGIFYDLDQNSKQSGVKTVSSLMPLIIPELPKEIVKRLVEGHLLNTKEFWTPVPISSVARDEKTFNPGRSLILWRGPMWINTNWFLTKGLLQYRYKTEAKELVAKTVEVISKNGFWEFYNPTTGEGYGQPGLGWSTLVLDMKSLF